MQILGADGKPYTDGRLIRADSPLVPEEVRNFQPEVTGPQRDWAILHNRWTKLPIETRRKYMRVDLLRDDKKALVFLRRKVPLRKDAPTFLTNRWWTKGANMVEFRIKDADNFTSYTKYLEDIRAFTRAAGIEYAIFNPSKVRIRDHSYHMHVSVKNPQMESNRPIAERINLLEVISRLEDGEITDIVAGRGFDDVEYKYEPEVGVRGILRHISGAHMEYRIHTLSPEQEAKYIRWQMLDLESANKEITAEISQKINPEIVKRILSWRPKFLAHVLQYLDIEKITTTYPQLYFLRELADFSRGPQAHYFLRQLYLYALNNPEFKMREIVLGTKLGISDVGYIFRSLEPPWESEKALAIAVSFLEKSESPSETKALVENLLFLRGAAEVLNNQNSPNGKKLREAIENSLRRFPTAMPQELTEVVPGIARTIFEENWEKLASGPRHGLTGYMSLIVRVSNYRERLVNFYRTHSNTIVSAHIGRLDPNFRFTKSQLEKTMADGGTDTPFLDDFLDLFRKNRKNAAVLADYARKNHNLNAALIVVEAFPDFFDRAFSQKTVEHLLASLRIKDLLENNLALRGSILTYLLKKDPARILEYEQFFPLTGQEAAKLKAFLLSHPEIEITTPRYVLLAESGIHFPLPDRLLEQTVLIGHFNEPDKILPRLLKASPEFRENFLRAAPEEIKRMSLETHLRLIAVLPDEIILDFIDESMVTQIAQTWRSPDGLPDFAKAVAKNPAARERLVGIINAHPEWAKKDSLKNLALFIPEIREPSIRAALQLVRSFRDVMNLISNETPFTADWVGAGAVLEKMAVNPSLTVYERYACAVLAFKDDIESETIRKVLLEMFRDPAFAMEKDFFGVTWLFDNRKKLAPQEIDLRMDFLRAIARSGRRKASDIFVLAFTRGGIFANIDYFPEQAAAYLSGGRRWLQSLGPEAGEIERTILKSLITATSEGHFLNKLSPEAQQDLTALIAALEVPSKTMMRAGAIAAHACNPQAFARFTRAAAQRNSN